MTDLNALAERLDGAADFIGDHDMLAPDLRQAAQALRGMGEALKAVDDMWSEDLNFLTEQQIEWRDTPFSRAWALVRSALKGRDGLE